MKARGTTRARRAANLFTGSSAPHYIRGVLAKKTDKAPPAPVEAPLDPISGSMLELFLVVVAIGVVALVALLFQLNVNRVFDVPKAVALKVGGCGIFITWLLTGLFGKGYAWRSIRVFLAPVAALTAAVTVSTFLSFDVATSIFGVYERQFGLHGFLGCVGLFVVAATCLRSKRGAMMGLCALAVIGGAVGAYSLLQAYGNDPYPFFFNKPHNKVYSFLGNATFAGNALALIAPISGLVAIVVSVKAVLRGTEEGEGPIALGMIVLGAALVLGLQIGPGWWAAGVSTMSGERRESVFKFGLALSFALVAALGAVGSQGPKALRFESASARRIADALGAGAIVAAVIGIGMGLLFTRTRGAWVGTACAMVGGFVLLPGLFNKTPHFKLVRNVCWGALGFAVVSMTFYVTQAEKICSNKKDRCFLIANTIRSIPAAFDPNRTDFGKGQGTRRYLWQESPRVLVDHGATLDRVFDDRRFAAENTQDVGSLEIGLAPMEAPTPDQVSSTKGWRGLQVWLTGIGIETYRYAFMSHKSKRLEALDPMTNHDNPHNNYLYVLASFGILGLAAYLWLLLRLLKETFTRFWRAPRRLLWPTESGGHDADLVREWSFDESSDPPRLYLDADDPKLVADSLKKSELKATVKIENDRVVVTKFDAKTVLDRIAQLPVAGQPTIADRAIAFGVLTSFFSYSVYSIAGFDSVACSVFLYFLLGCAAVYFEPSADERERPIGVNVRRWWTEWRGGDPASIDNVRPIPLSIGLAVVLVPLLFSSLVGAKMSWDAERAFVGARGGARSRLDLVNKKIDNIGKAIRINPYESYYKQNLGSAYGDGARIFQRQAVQMAREGKDQQAAAYRAEADRYAKKALIAMYAALDHAWAPENIFISAFQLHYALGEIDKAEAALERALVHSPHLGAVRANLAVLKLERRGYDDAMKDAQWVLEVDPRSAIAHRVAGQVYTHRKRFDLAKHHLDKAMRYAKRDRAVQRAVQQLEAAKKAASSTTG